MALSSIPCARCTGLNHPANRSCTTCGLPLGDPSVDPDAGQHALGPYEPPDPSDPDLGPAMRDLVARSGLEVCAAEHGWCLVVPLRLDRKQAVYLGSGGIDPTGRPLLLLVSVCGPAHPRDDRRLLELNTRAVAGHFAVKLVRGEPYVVVVRFLTVEDAREVEAARLIRDLALQADSMEERLLRGADLY